jgi:hypothetical protein
VRVASSRGGAGIYDWDGKDLVSVAKLNETIENIGKREDHLQRKIDAELGNAKKFHAGGMKREALQCLQKKKMYEEQLATLGTSKMTLESTKFNTEILDAQKGFSMAMKEIAKKVGGVDKVEELMDEVEDALQTDAREISEAMGRQLDLPGIDADDDELAKLVGLMEDELADEECELAELEAAMSG